MNNKRGTSAHSSNLSSWKKIVPLKRQAGRRTATRTSSRTPPLVFALFNYISLNLPLPLPKSWLSANRQISDDVIACDLWFRPPQSKILATPINWRLSEKLFWRPFFLWRTLAAVSLVLGLGLEHSCPWPQEGLSSERLSLASDFFCVLGVGLEPCVLDSTSVK